MDELMEKMQSILSDPESMQQISELAQMLKGDAGADPPAPQSPPPSSGGFDPAMLLKLGEIMNNAKKEDANTALLTALRPHLKEKRREKVDRAVKILQLLTIFNLLKENGMLQNLL